MAASILAAASTVSPAGATIQSSPVLGAGSTWAAVAFQQWTADVARQGLSVSYQPVGYQAGLQAYIDGSADFAVTEQPFTPAQLAELATSSRGPAFVYVPVLAGATAALFNLVINGTRLNSIRLSVKALCGMFTGRITNWDDPVIVADNPGVTFPNLAAIAVVNSQASADTLIFSTWCDALDHADWTAFTAAHNLASAPIDQWPPGIQNVAEENGSDGVANYVSSPFNNGAVGLAESAYGLVRGLPEAALANRTHFFIFPSEGGVEAALSGGSALPGRNWSTVRSSDASAYPLSIVSYVVAQTKGFDRSKGATLRAFLDYATAQGQLVLVPLGYARPSARLLRAAANRIAQIPT